MPIAAVPEYLGNDFKDASPGLRFGMYLKLWGIDRRSQELLWKTHDLGSEVRGQQHQEREVKYENKVSALAEAKLLGERDKQCMKALAERQLALAQAMPNLLRLDATATAPFTTGLGNEHPLENGFAFLNPYGLPYLPGSGVKGVLRQAARELASGDWGDRRGWSDEKCFPLMQGKGEKHKAVLDKHEHPVTLSMLDILFGRESEDGDSEHLRGALSFWDVIPQIAPEDPKTPNQISLMVEIMTPHQSHYYQQTCDRKTGDSTSPHDSGQPTPINFLTVPPGSGFAFHVGCTTALLARHAPELFENERWKSLLTAAFEHAFAWLGFGAKTAVGYGAMESEAMREMRRKSAEERRQREAAETKRAEEARQEAEATSWPGARIKFNRANKSLSAEKDSKVATAIAPKGEQLLASLPADVRKKVETNQFVKATAYVSGSVLVRVEVP